MSPADSTNPADSPPPIKYGRGRPRKGEHRIKKIYVPTGRPRGRPRGSGLPKQPYVPTGRPRGRPKGSGKKGKEIAAATAEMTASNSMPSKNPDPDTLSGDDGDAEGENDDGGETEKRLMQQAFIMLKGTRRRK